MAEKVVISFVMPAKDGGKYIGNAIGGLLSASFNDWELIVVEDHSEDNTFEIAKKYESQDSRIKIVRNLGKGKVQGLNYGYSLTRGDYIKCIDSDDILLDTFFDTFDQYKSYDAYCHACRITDGELNVLTTYNMDTSIVEKDFDYCIRNLKSIPRWSWTFTREIADRVFPMPEDLPFEDVWFSLLIKKNAKSIGYDPEASYLYRQHESQTFGGVLNSNKEVIMFRANRILKLLIILCRDFKDRFDSIDEMFSEVKLYNTILSKDKLSYKEIFFSGLNRNHKLKVLAFRKFAFIVPILIRVKWFLDRKSTDK